MPSFTSSYPGAELFYEKSSRHATHTFNQDSAILYRNQPRVPFEYYVSINLNNVSTASSYIASFFNNPNWQQVAPLIKSVEMPSMKIDTTHVNQYNRKRMSQNNITFEPVKMVFHDVVDGKTLKFWEMYYRYYFADGNEPGMNDPKRLQQDSNTYAVEIPDSGISPSYDANLSGAPAWTKNSNQSSPTATTRYPTNTLGQKAALSNIVNNTLDNHNFGYNLQSVYNIRNLIQSIDIYQVHGGRFNQVRLVNPRIAAFTHDVLNYSTTDKSLEMTFAFEYEYAYYIIQNMVLEGGEANNNSSIEPFIHGDFLELSTLNFQTASLDFIESNNPILSGDNDRISTSLGNNSQATINSVSSAFANSNPSPRTSTSALDGIVNITPGQYVSPTVETIVARPFASTATRDSTMYQDTNRTGKELDV